MILEIPKASFSSLEEAVQKASEINQKYKYAMAMYAVVNNNVYIVIYFDGQLWQVYQNPHKKIKPN